MPNPKPELHYENAFQLLVAVILSAQCTDKRVNLITPHLFEKYQTAEALSKASEEQIYNIIKSCSYPNNKAKYYAQFAPASTKKQPCIEKAKTTIVELLGDSENVSQLREEYIKKLNEIDFAKAELLTYEYV